MEPEEKEDKGFFAGLKDKIASFFFGIALKKLVKRIVQLVVSLAASAKAKEAGLEVGVNEAQLTVAVYAVIEWVRGQLKHKFPDKFGWL